jgi:hypothetical protein
METHFATMSANGEWVPLCGTENPERIVKGTLVIAADISCPACRSKFLSGTRRMRDLFEERDGEE